MPVRAHVLHRPAESRAVEDFLAAAVEEPSALVLEGEAGIGKTTVWLAAVEEAVRRGFTVLSTRPAAAEVTLAHGAIADLLRCVSPEPLAGLPPPQRRAVQQVLQLTSADGGPTDPQAIGAALLSVVGRLCAEGPVLLAVDDAQWLDASSVAVLAFLARRLPRPLGVLVTVRTGGSGGPVPWLQLPRPEAVVRRPVPPMSRGATGCRCPSNGPAPNCCSGRSSDGCARRSRLLPRSTRRRGSSNGSARCCGPRGHVPSSLGWVPGLVPGTPSRPPSAGWPSSPRAG